MARQPIWDYFMSRVQGIENIVHLHFMQLFLKRFLYQQCLRLFSENWFRNREIILYRSSLHLSFLVQFYILKTNNLQLYCFNFNDNFLTIIYH